MGQSRLAITAINDSHAIVLHKSFARPQNILICSKENSCLGAKKVRFNDNGMSYNNECFLQQETAGASAVNSTATYVKAAPSLASIFNILLSKKILSRVAELG